mmetsp:Transcript_15774/g.42626  ORF Transcript_15774/g.42626 Transcript_15774/m.42626 type:complete len:102 (+) Transcript_15774:126-431(+)
MGSAPSMTRRHYDLDQQTLNNTLENWRRDWIDISETVPSADSDQVSTPTNCSDRPRARVVSFDKTRGEVFFSKKEAPLFIACRVPEPSCEKKRSTRLQYSI